jgi:hypothetical protein
LEQILFEGVFLHVCPRIFEFSIWLLSVNAGTQRSKLLISLSQRLGVQDIFLLGVMHYVFLLCQIGFLDEALDLSFVGLRNDEFPNERDRTGR